MDGSERVFLDTLLIDLLPAIPLAAAMIIGYIKIKANSKRIDNRPTRDELDTAIHSKVAELTSTTPTDSGGNQ